MAADRAALGLAGIEIRRGEDDLVADLPALGIQHLDRGGAGVGRGGQLGPGVGGGSPCRFSVPPEIMMPRSPMPTMMSSPLTLSVRVMVALRVWGLASVPMANSPCSMIHSVVSSRSALLAKLSLPSMVRPPRAGGLTSSTTSLSLPMMTLSPAAGTLLVRPGGRIGPVRRPD